MQPHVLRLFSLNLVLAGVALGASLASAQESELGKQASDPLSREERQRLSVEFQQNLSILLADLDELDEKFRDAFRQARSTFQDQAERNRKYESRRVAYPSVDGRSILRSGLQSTEQALERIYDSRHASTRQGLKRLALSLDRHWEQLKQTDSTADPDVHSDDPSVETVRPVVSGRLWFEQYERLANSYQARINEIQSDIDSVEKRLPDGQWDWNRESFEERLDLRRRFEADAASLRGCYREAIVAIATEIKRLRDPDVAIGNIALAKLRGMAEQLADQQSHLHEELQQSLKRSIYKLGKYERYHRVRNDSLEIFDQAVAAEANRVQRSICRLRGELATEYQSYLTTIQDEATYLLDSTGGERSVERLQRQAVRVQALLLDAIEDHQRALKNLIAAIEQLPTLDDPAANGMKAKTLADLRAELELLRRRAE